MVQIKAPLSLKLTNSGSSDRKTCRSNSSPLVNKLVAAPLGKLGTAIPPLAELVKERVLMVDIFQKKLYPIALLYSSVMRVGSDTFGDLIFQKG